jgi:hypothetical protein
MGNIGNKFKVGDRVRVIALKGSLANNPLVDKLLGTVHIITDLREDWDRPGDAIILDKDYSLYWYPEELEHVNRQLTFTFVE